MKVNVISDIHATVDKHNNVIYNLPLEYKPEKYEYTVQVLKEYLNAHADEYKDVDIKHNCLNEAFPETIVLKTFDDILKFIDLLEIKVKTQFAGTSKDEMYNISRALGNVEWFLIQKNVDWHWHKNTLRLDSVRDYMFKCLYDFDPAKLEPADYLIIAGDLGLEPTYDLILKDIEAKTAGKFKKILHIAGNHDHWWVRVDGISEVKPSNINLDRDYCTHVDGDYAFIGCTMWTPISDQAVWNVGRYMNDYRYIPGKFSPYASSHQFEIQSAWIRKQLAKYRGKKCIIFTHHQPFEELTLDDYKHNGKGWDGIDVNAAYVVQNHSLDDIAKGNNIVLWACGHTHANFDGVLHGIHVVRNPIGYRDVMGYSHTVPENISGTWYNKIIEV